MEYEISFLEMLLVSFNICRTTSVIQLSAQSVNRGLSPSGDRTWTEAHQTNSLMILWLLSLAKSEARIISSFQASSGGWTASPSLEIWENKRRKKIPFIPDPDQNCTFIILISQTIWTTKFWNLLLTWTFKVIPILWHCAASQILPWQALITYIYLPEPCRFRGLPTLPTASLTSDTFLTLKSSTIPWPTMWAADQTLLLPVWREL